MFVTASGIMLLWHQASCSYGAMHLSRHNTLLLWSPRRSLLPTLPSRQGRRTRTPHVTRLNRCHLMHLSHWHATRPAERSHSSSCHTTITTAVSAHPAKLVKLSRVRDGQGRRSSLLISTRVTHPTCVLRIAIDMAGYLTSPRAFTARWRAQSTLRRVQKPPESDPAGGGCLTAHGCPARREGTTAPKT